MHRCTLADVRMQVTVEGSVSIGQNPTGVWIVVSTCVILLFGVGSIIYH